MRARGASVTDIIVLVVAADDGVMPQTKEAVAHAKAAKVPIIVAINKIDKPGADPERVKRELGELGLVPEEWGGETIFVPVSARDGRGDRQAARVDPAPERDPRAQGERRSARRAAPCSRPCSTAAAARSRASSSRTARCGSATSSSPGAGFGKVRAMTNEHGKQLQEAGPATPVEILGLNEVPNAGDRMDAVKDPKKAQEVAESRKGKMAKSLIPATAKVSLEELSKRIAESGQQELRVIIKGDVQGSVEALADAMAKLTDREGAALGHQRGRRRHHRGRREPGHRLAGDHRRLQRAAGRQGELARRGEQDRDSPLLDHLQRARGRARRDGGPAASDARREAARQGRGPSDLQGQGRRRRRLLRDRGQDRPQRQDAPHRATAPSSGTGKIESLKRFKDDAREVPEGMECGISLEGYNDIKEKDVLESYEVEEIKQKL